MWKMATWKPGILRPDLGKLGLFETAERAAAPGRVRQLVAAAAAEGRTRSEIVELVAQELYDDELANGGWMHELGVWGPSLYAQEAKRLVAQMLGGEDGDRAPSTRPEAV